MIPNVPLILIIIAMILIAVGMGLYTQHNDMQKYYSRIKKIQKNAYGNSNSNLGDSGIFGYLKKIEKQIAINFSGFVRDKSSDFRLKFEQAGLDSTYATSLTVLLKIAAVLSGIFIYLGLITLTSFKYSSLIMKIIVLLLIFLISMRLFELVMDFKIKHRYRRIQRSLAFSVDMLAICTRSSLGLDQAFEKIADEMTIFNEDLANEFRRISTELRIIPDRAQALRNFVKRVNLPMTHLLVSGLVHAIEHGVSLSQTLTNLSAEFSKHRLIAVEEKAAKLPVLLTIPLALFCLPATMIILMGPIFATLRDLPIFNN